MPLCPATQTARLALGATTRTLRDPALSLAMMVSDTPVVESAGGGGPPSGVHRLMLAEITGMIKAVGLQISAGCRNFGKGCLRQNLGGDVIDRTVGNLVDEADILVFAGRNPRNDFTPGDFGLDDRLAPASPVVGHHDKILHEALSPASGIGLADQLHHFRKSEISQAIN